MQIGSARPYMMLLGKGEFDKPVMFITETVLTSPTASREPETWAATPRRTNSLEQCLTRWRRHCEAVARREVVEMWARWRIPLWHAGGAGDTFLRGPRSVSRTI